MDAIFLSLLSLLTLGLCVVIAANSWWISRRHEHEARDVIDQALQWQAALVRTNHASVAASSSTPTPVRTGPGILSKLLGSRLGQSLVATEDISLLEQAGLGNRRSRITYLLLRLACMPLLIWLAYSTALALSGPPLFICAWGLACGLLLPKWWLKSRVRTRRQQAHRELPLFVDLLRLLQGTGLSLDASLRVIPHEFRDQLPVLSGEIDISNRQYAAGRSRNDALSRLSKMFGTTDWEELTALLGQIEKHGGAVQEPMRQYALRLREKRRSALRESVGKINVKMTLVMILTLLPALMIVIAGPAFQAILRGIATLKS